MSAKPTNGSVCRHTGIDVLSTAAKLVACHGSDAALVARRWASIAMLAGDTHRCAAWRRIVNEAKTLSNRRNRSDRASPDP
ncbi:MAG: hypothetical protein QF926_09985 [Alphaproteobacteria bacterium]|jgi:hypothetical protein|nr:hypothetical protein [Alphaproteobacteria bacterium]MDP6516934.1 hypothetical protein [Alphaproteobacteria bacterium]|tara:strand:- start:247 stop:489 length:243 start_codon:yes stop_codon:yes gene_type:complete